MKTELATFYGKLFIERNTIFLRNYYLPFGDTAFAKLGLELLFIIAFIMQFFKEETARRQMGIVLWGFLLLSRLPSIYQLLFKTSFSNRIPLNNIASFTVTEDQHGLKTCIRLQLKNGRYRKIEFRKLEQQADILTEYIVHHQTATQTI